MANPITFETLLQSFPQLCEDMAFIKRHLLERSNENQTETERWFNIDELCEYLPDKPAKATVYGYVHSLSIPFHKTTKRLRFLKSEIDNWLKQGRKKTLAEITGEADRYLIKKRGANNG